MGIRVFCYGYDGVRCMLNRALAKPCENATLQRRCLHVDSGRFHFLPYFGNAYKLAKNMNSRTILQHYTGCSGVAIPLTAVAQKMVLSVAHFVLESAPYPRPLEPPCLRGRALCT